MPGGLIRQRSPPRNVDGKPNKAPRNALMETRLAVAIRKLEQLTPSQVRRERFIVTSVYKHMMQHAFDHLQVHSQPAPKAVKLPAAEAPAAKVPAAAPPLNETKEEA